MFSSGLEHFAGREIVVVDRPTVLLIVHGDLQVSRQVEHLGLRWSIEIRGRWLVLPRGTYLVSGKATIFIGAEASPAPPPPGARPPRAVGC